ncbi:MAG TPA: ABC transporter substrate-binding protein, partial [Chloroflexota bacterium]|nr:ABC transporter substrate-binding protein [Chloroflexota bacterium]
MTVNAYDRKSVRLTRRSALGLGTGLLGAVLVAACSSAAPSTPASTQPAASAPKPTEAPKPAATPASNQPAAAPTTAKPAAAPTTAQPATAAPTPATNGKEKTAVILQGMVNHYGAKPYALWSGVSFWGNAGQPSRILWAPIVDLDENLKIMPGLAESWEAVDNKTTKFHLRSGLKWSDGTPL